MEEIKNILNNIGENLGTWLTIALTVFLAITAVLEKTKSSWKFWSPLGNWLKSKLLGEIKEEIKNFRDECLIDKNYRYRHEIFSFFDGLRRNVSYTKDEYDHIFEIIEKYELLSEDLFERKLISTKNGRMTNAINVINEHFHHVFSPKIN